MDDAERLRRATAALRAFAVGDAIGAATEGYRADEIEDVYDAPVLELVEPVNLYPESGPDRALGEIGPQTRAMLAFAERLLGGGSEVIETGALGWCVPLGVVVRAGEIDRLLALTPTVPNDERAAGCAVAAAIAAGIDGYGAREAVGQAALAASRAGSDALALALTEAARIGQTSGGRLVAVEIASVFPPGPGAAAATAFAFGVAFGTQSVRRAIPDAVNQGGEASLTAAIAGAVCASFAPGSLVDAWAREVEGVNELDLGMLAPRLLGRT